MYYFSWYEREALVLHISSVVKAPFRNLIKRVKNGKISWKVDVRYSDSVNVIKGVVTTKELAKRVDAIKLRYKN